MANKIWICTALTGGGTDAVDGIPYASITDGDILLTFVSGVFRSFKWDATNSSVENVATHPYNIKADDQGANNGAWEEQTPDSTSIDHDLCSNFLATEHKTSAVIRAENDISVIIENRTSDPTTPATGQIWIRTDLA